MIRIINMDGQVNEGEKMFAVWDTVTDKFLSFADSQSWSSANELYFDMFSESKRVSIETCKRILALVRSAGY